MKDYIFWIRHMHSAPDQCYIKEDIYLGDDTIFKYYFEIHAHNFLIETNYKIL